MKVSGNCSDFVVETFLDYWPSWYVLRNKTDNGLSMFLLAILIAKEMRFVLTIVYLGSLYSRLDRFMSNKAASTI